MNHSFDLPLDVHSIVQNLVRRPLRWGVPAAVIALAALGYAIVKPSKWEASQALVMRDAAAGAVMPAGRFASVDEMQTAQRTVLELAQSQGVIATALKQVGPASGKPRANWPTLQDIAAVRSAIKIHAPNGAEFGRTEVFYLQVEDRDRNRAVMLTEAICDALDIRLSKLRDDKAQSLIDELQNTVRLAHTDLQQATYRLSGLEGSVGSDLSELRSLNEASSGESVLRQAVTNIRNEIRSQEAEQLANRQLFDVLTAAAGDTAKIVATPSQLLQSQPGLQRLKDGLVDAQLRTSQSLGMMSANHPKVQAAVAEEQDIRRRLHDEIDVASRGLQVELDMNAGRLASLNKQLAEVQTRMSRLASMRAEYHNLSSEVAQRTEVWNKAQKDLSEARASQAAAHSASLMTRLDAPQMGAYPVGPSRSMIALAGIVGGLLTGLGIAVLFAVPVSPGSKTAAAAMQHDESSPVAVAELRTTVATPALQQSPTVVRRPPPAATRGTAGLSLKEALLRIALGEPEGSQV